MLTRAEKARRLAFVVVVIAALGFLVFQLYSKQPPPRGRCAFADCAKDETLRAVLPVGMNGASNTTDIATLDPARVVTYDTTAMIVVNQLFDGLVTFDKLLQVEPWGAKSWTISPDGLTYTFTLQPNQKFSDGVPVKASDYAWALNRSIAPCVGESSTAVYWALIKDATSFHAETCSIGQPGGAIKPLVGRSIVPDDSANTLTITLARPAGYFLAMLAYPWASVIEQQVVTGDSLGKDGRWLDSLVFGATGEGGSGMLYVSKWDHAGGMALKPNPHWWGRKPNFTTIYYTFVNANDNPNAAFDTFKVDSSLGFTTMLPDTPDRPVTSLKNQSYYREQPALGMSWLAFNQQQAPFDDVNARKAFCLAINREQLNQQVYQGANIPRWDIIPPELLSYSDVSTRTDNGQGTAGYPGLVTGIDHAPLAGDVGLAQFYWQKYLAAHGGHAPALTLYTPDPQSRRGQLTTSLREVWERSFGISIRLDDAISHPLTARPPSVYVVPTGWDAEYPDPQNFMSQAVLWDGARMSTPADALLRRADALNDTSQRIPLYTQAEQALIDNAVVCPLFQGVNHYAARTWIKGPFAEDGRGIFSTYAWQMSYVIQH
jgi:oligopeptide transport system substrate-binding protein